MKTKRHAMIIKIIASRDVETQEELARLLGEQGFQVTQATVSRDIKELRLIKVLTSEGHYKYATVEHLIVIKTISGSASVAGEAIDSLKWPEIAGSIAGDNTIFVAIREGKNAAEIIKRFQKMMK